MSGTSFSHVVHPRLHSWTDAAPHAVLRRLWRPCGRGMVVQAARRADSGTIVIIRASHDHEAGETAQTALFRGNAVRDELIREGVPNSAIRILISDATGTGIEARRVVVSVIPVAMDE